MRVLVGCEESQTVTKAFRERGHEAYSCDLQECSGGHPEWHFITDVLQIIPNGYPMLRLRAETQDGTLIRHIKDWDLFIGHPPCTFISKAGARWMHAGGKVNEDRLAKAMDARDFFMRLLNIRVERVAIENPQPLKIVGLPQHTQAIQPYQFGDPYSKKTLLWLKGLPELKPTNVLTEYKPYLPSNTGGAKRGQKFMYKSISQKDSSKTFPGIARAMAEQWSNP